MRLKRWALVGCMLLAMKGKAQEEELELNPVTVTASLHPVTVSKTGRNLLVIKGESFASLPVHSIDELLRYLPGIEVQARGPMGAQSDFVLRGGTFQQVLVILDGLRINDPVTGHFNSYIPIAPAEIDHIEVLKGASSAIYGSEAVGGVVHIITKTFSKGNKKVLNRLQGQLLTGEYGLLNAHAGGTYTKGNTAIAGGLLANTTNGQPQRGTKGFLKVYTGSFSIAQQLSQKWKLSYRTAYDSRRFAAQNFYTTFVSDTAEESVKTFWNAFKTDYTSGNHHFDVQVGYKTGEDNYVYNSASLPNLNKSKLWQALTTYQYSWQKTVLTTGAQFQNKVIRSNDRGNHAITQAAFFMVVDQQVTENFNVNPALRLDWNSRSGTELVPQINLSYQLHNFQFRGSAGKTIREADFTERFNNYNKATVSSGRIGYPDLVAETSFSYEAGVDYFLKGFLKVSATYFRRNHHDLIDYVTTPYSNMPRKTNLVPGGTYALAQNIASVTTDGAELDVLFSKKLSKHYHLWSSAGLLWLGTNSSGSTPSFYIASHARFLGNFSAVLQAPGFNISTSGLYKLRGAQAANDINAKVTKDYFVLNAKAEVFVWKRKLSLVAQVDNIFDRQYSDLLGAAMPGRWVMGGVKANF